MRRPSSSSRRAFLTGTAAAGTVALAGCSTVFSVLPDRAAYGRTRRREIPDVPPAVETTTASLEETADEIADHAASGLAAWDRMEPPAERTTITGRQLETAAEFADALPTEPPVVSTVESAGYHLSQAATAEAYARSRLDEFDADPTAGVADGLEETAAVTEQFTYETADIETFLAYGRSVEYSLSQAEQGLSRRQETDIESHGKTSRAERVARVYGDVQRSRLRVRDAKAYRDALRERDTGGSDIRNSLAESRAELNERIRDLRDDHQEWETRLDTAEFADDRRDVHSALYSRSSAGRSPTSTADRHVENGYEVHGTVTLALSWLRLAAARDERERIETDGTDELDPTPIDEAKREALDRLENRLETDPKPLARLFLSESRDLLAAGDRGLERRSSTTDEERRWELANGYARYLLARGMLDRIPEAVALLADGSVTE
ncbi:hypothetical protein [Natrialba aegyptia]|uniref:Uncharacterized protein n=1 Tax=Natrialba aegyptia DSM 13077 TaxID=1227491 RepID=M0B4E4_9EURY|nr:hypothetical protein [Natrialba aegyptia]ELZ05123.1 hypothetical protein C480_10949 [Natrialba aegyptia DSM 13077]